MVASIIAEQQHGSFGNRIANGNYYLYRYRHKRSLQLKSSNDHHYGEPVLASNGSIHFINNKCLPGGMHHLH